MLLCYWFVVFAAGIGWFVGWTAGWPKPRRDHAVIVFFFVAYILSVCFRASTVGVDTGNYVRYFDSGVVVGWDSAYYYGSSESGFKFISAVLAFFGDHGLFFFVTGLVSLLPIAILYYRESESGPLCCSFFLISLLFEFFYSGLRQGLAVGIGIVAFLFVQKKKPLYFLACVALAMSFHSSAFVLLALYPLYHAKVTQKWVPFVVLVMVGIYIARDTLFNTVLLPMFGGEYLEGYSYLTNESTQGSLSVLFLALAIYSCIVLDPRKADAETLGFRNLLFLAAAIHVFTPLHPVVCRMNYYFIPFIPIALSKVNNRAKGILLPVVQMAEFVLPLFFVVYFLFMKDDPLLIAPYVPFFA